MKHLQSTKQTSTSITIWRKNINILKRTTTSPNVSLQFPSVLTTNPRSWVSFATPPHHLKPMQFMIQGQWWSIFLKAAKGASGDFIQWWCCNFNQKSYKQSLVGGLGRLVFGVRLHGRGTKSFPKLPMWVKFRKLLPDSEKLILVWSAGGIPLCRFGHLTRGVMRVICFLMLAWVLLNEHQLQTTYVCIYT